jgi:hypothetical protein
MNVEFPIMQVSPGFIYGNDLLNSTVMEPSFLQSHYEDTLPYIQTWNPERDIEKPGFVKRVQQLAMKNQTFSIPGDAKIIEEEWLEPNACIDAYHQNFQSSRGGLVLVLDLNSSTYTHWMEPVVFSVYDTTGSNNSYPFQEPFGWICQQQDPYVFPHSSLRNEQDYKEWNQRSCSANLKLLKDDKLGWRPDGYRIKSCISERIEETCKLQFSIHVACIVLAINLFKAIVMVSLALSFKEKPLLTVGDAIASFLTNEDEETKHMCLADQRQFPSRSAWSTEPRAFESSIWSDGVKDYRLSYIMTPFRWYSCFLL